ncbi:MAG TPA: redox-sensing transcriptional repressor Rex [Candidatus Elarobacter sp.]|nr:redox-sensing transcriptional repressor Rex [Candidatus Elarobacter sp.]
MKRVPDSTVRRLSLYLGFLEELEAEGAPTVSSDVLARLGGTTSAQVRKDLSIFGSFGKRGLGYSVPELTGSLRKILGLERTWRVCIVGAGKIGLALAQYPGFPEKGFNVAAVYDAAPAKIGTHWDSLVVRDVRELPADAARNHFDIGVIAVPAEAAQPVADQMVAAGIRAVMNFAPAQITTPPDVITRTVNMGLEFEALSFALANRAK